MSTLIIHSATIPTAKAIWSWKLSHPEFKDCFELAVIFDSTKMDLDFLSDQIEKARTTCQVDRIVLIDLTKALAENIRNKFPEINISNEVLIA